MTSAVSEHQNSIEFPADALSTRTLAAVDLGSNSFHMIVARVKDGALDVIDREREMVRLAGGIGKSQRIDDITQQRALDTLARFGQRLRSLSSDTVRVVGTKTLRSAKNSEEFIRVAEEVLGHPIEVISGHEEARLVYQGVIHSVAARQQRQLVVDIGGASTECIIGEGPQPMLLESLSLGCVSLSRRFFEDGLINEKNLRAAEIFARAELRNIQQRYLAHGWERAIGSSGTIRAIGALVAEAGWSRGIITPEAMRKLRETLLDIGKISALSERLPALKSERAPVMAGGFAVLSAVFDTFKLEEMHVSDGALREGLLYDLAGRIQHSDIREQTLQRLLVRYEVDRAHAESIRSTSMRLLRQAESAWDLHDERFHDALRHAALLHEIGLVISHSKYQRHGAYLLEHADLSGFSMREQTILSLLVLGHRRKFPLEALQELGVLALPITRLVVILRLAVLLHRGRMPLECVPALAINKNHIGLEFSEGWLKEHPLSQADLEQEAKALKKVGFELNFYDNNAAAMRA